MNKKEDKKRIAVVRVRGSINVSADIKDTMDMLNLRRVNYCAVVDNRPVYMGMINKVKDYVTWGEIDQPTFVRLLEKWGRVSNEKALTVEHLKSKGHASVEDFSKKFFDFKVELKDAVKPYFALHPPYKGYDRGGVKHPRSMGGALGHRGKDINKLIVQMAGLGNGKKG